MTTFKEELSSLINRHSRENLSDTPDFILAQFMLDCLAAFEITTRRRDIWYGKGQDAPAKAPTDATGG